MLLFGAESSVIQVAVQKLKIKIYRTIILPAVLYGCETWSLILREESRLRVFENRVLRRTFRPKRGEVRGDAFLTHYCSGYQIEKNKMGGVCSTHV